MRPLWTPRSMTRPWPSTMTTSELRTVERRWVMTNVVRPPHQAVHAALDDGLGAGVDGARGLAEGYRGKQRFLELSAFVALRLGATPEAGKWIRALGILDGPIPTQLHIKAGFADLLLLHLDHEAQTALKLSEAVDRVIAAQGGACRRPARCKTAGDRRGW